jgi:flagellar protein FliS
LLPDAHSQYKETQVLTASQGQLIVMLYDGAIKFIKNAAKNMGDKTKYDSVNNDLIRAQDIITELMLSLNFDAGEISSRLYSLYMYFNKKLIEGNIQKDAKPLKEVLTHLENLRESWSQIANQTAESAPAKLGVNIST